MSTFWGFYGIVDEANKDTEVEVVTERHGKVVYYTKTQTKYIGKITNPKKGWEKLGTMYSFGAFLSDFVWSILGWFALYVLLSQYRCIELVNLNIFLGIVAIVGITGYGFKIPEKMKVG
ncbi:hypothetical protein [Sulfuricurvum sp.]|uniref:hypothetical protein n=1 Tax=Sulfuricurvum sp. TaxID=2025608 RepID=UPI002D23C78D|nr:hypothetical protein [Sulfuricurvum sp.]HZF69755.1 hypothetical protein [Sulfuricurvum sp.]